MDGELDGWGFQGMELEFSTALQGCSAVAVGGWERKGHRSMTVYFTPLIPSFSSREAGGREHLASGTVAHWALAETLNCQAPAFFDRP